MTSAGRLPGSANPFANIGRVLFAVGAIAIGLFVFAISATFLLFVALAVVVIAALAVFFLWARARLTGRPFGPKEQFEAMFADIQLEMQSHPVAEDDGVVLDAHRTPDGWSVDR